MAYLFGYNSLNINQKADGYQLKANGLALN